MSLCLQEKWPDTPVDERSQALGSGGPARLFRAADPAIDHAPRPTEYRFGDWCLVPRARLLLHHGEPVELGSRAFDLLHLLLSRRGFVVEKSMIVQFVWPNTTVEESNLRFQMATLRKTLGRQRDLIKTIPGRGYILAAEYKPAG